MIPRDVENPGIVSGVAGTALGVAQARAWESTSQQPLFMDPYARMFIDAAGRVEPHPSPESRMAITNYAAARTKWFDDYFLSASASGLSQVVILGAGLDARAWRLPWLSDTAIYEVDHPDVLTFKAATLAASAAEPAATYRAVAVDLREDWPSALAAAGFDHTEPTAWSAEGLLPYLSAAEQDRLFDQIRLYSARDSRIAVEAFSPRFFEPDNLARYREQVGGAAVESGGAVDSAEHLWVAEERTDVAAWLCCHRWEVTSTDAADLMDRYHRTPAGPGGPLALSVFVEGHLL